MANNDQSRKNNAGKTLRKTVEMILELLQNAQLIAGFKGKGTNQSNSPHYGYPDMEKQFRCDYVYTLLDGREILIHTETSYDNGRFKTKEWDSYHIKKIEKNIKKAFVIIPDTAPQTGEHSFSTIKDKMERKAITTYIDGVYNQTEFLHLLEDEILGTKLNGQKAAKKGFIFEMMLVCVLSLPQNIEKWKNPSSGIIGWKFDLFEKITDYLKLNPNQIEKLTADRNIASVPDYKYPDGTIKHGGKAKTDVELTVHTLNGCVQKYTISCKNTSQNMVHVNQFSSKYVVSLFDMQPADEIYELLELYRKDGGPGKFYDNHPTEYKKLELLLKPFVDDFEKWCLKGAAIDGSVPRQIAEYLVTCQTQKGKERYEIIDIDKYIVSVRSGSTKKTFGTVFSWTVTQKDKNGENEIRVKAKILK